jgi:integrase
LWFDQTQRKRLERPEVVERVLKNHLIPKLGDLALSDVKPAHIIACLHSIIDGGAPTVANDARRHIKKIFDYGIVLQEIEISPAAQIDHKIVGHDESARDRSLSLGEFKKLYRSIEHAREWFGRDNEITIALLLMLGVRKGELIGAKWSEFDLTGDWPTWTIPKARTKTRKIGKPKDFTIPLPAQAADLFKELEIRACGSDWVLPARRRGVRKLGHISGDTINRIMEDLDTGIDLHFTIHDLRRTMRSCLSALGVPFAVAERALNHKLPGLAETYDQHDFFEQRADALQRWADTLDVLTSEGVKEVKEFIGGA